MVLAGDLVPAGTTLVTPVVEYAKHKTELETLCKMRNLSDLFQARQATLILSMFSRDSFKLFPNLNVSLIPCEKNIVRQ